MQTPAALAQQSANKPDQQDEPLRLKTELVEVRAVVTDKQGKVITGLNKDDFEIVENGHEQAISFFSAEEVSRDQKTTSLLPGTSPAGRPGPKATSQPKRTIVLFIDTLHMANLSLIRLKQELLKFVDERLSDDDAAAVVSTGGGLGLFSQFTQDKRVLRSAINRLSGSPGSMSNTYFTPYLAGKVEADDASALEVAKNIIRQEQALYDPHMEDVVTQLAKSRAREIMAESTYLRRATLLSLKSVTDRLAELPGQRMILLASDGFTLLENSGMRDVDDLRAAISRASRSGVVIYSFNAQGLRGLSLYDVDVRLPSNPQMVTLLQTLAVEGDRELESGMETLAKDTGGEAFMTTNDLKGAMDKALDDNGYYYAMSYYPSNPDEKNKKAFHTIKVRVKGHPEYKVRTQNGYLAGDLVKEQAPQMIDPGKILIKAMSEPLSTNGINVDVDAEFLYLPSDNNQVSVNVFIEGKNLNYREDGDSFVTAPMLMTGVLDSSGKTTAVKQDVIQLKLSRKQMENSRTSAYRYAERLPLKPGLYQIRVGVRDPLNGLVGTGSAWVEVPDLKSKKLILSSISTFKLRANSDASGKQTGLSVSQPNVRDGVNLFRPGDFITYYGKAYKAGLDDKQISELMVQGQILLDDKVVFTDEWRPLSSFVLKKDPDSVEFGGRLPAGNFKPGFYTLRLLVKALDLKVPLQKETVFEVTP